MGSTSAERGYSPEQQQHGREDQMREQMSGSGAWRTGVSRRFALGAGLAGVTLAAFPALGAARAGAVGAAGAAGAGSPSLTGPFLDLTTPMGNVEAYARINGDVDPEAVSYSWYMGRMAGVRPGEAARDLMGVIGMGTVKMLPRDGGAPGYLMLRKELGFFTDIETGEILRRWTNPYTGETLEVDHIANPSINAEIKPYLGEVGLYEEIDTPRERAFILPWKIVGDRAIVERHDHLWVRNPLDPAVWRRESSGAMIAISDANTFNVALADLQNPALTKVPSQGHWVHRRPWQPWMLMGQEEGFLEYNCVTGSVADLDSLPAQIVAEARTNYPDFLVPATEMTKAESSLARYMRTRKPAPPLAPEP